MTPEAYEKSAAYTPPPSGPRSPKSYRFPGHSLDTPTSPTKGKVARAGTSAMALPYLYERRTPGSTAEAPRASRSHSLTPQPSQPRTTRRCLSCSGDVRDPDSAHAGPQDTIEPAAQVGCSGRVAVVSHAPGSIVDAFETSAHVYSCKCCISSATPARSDTCTHTYLPSLRHLTWTYFTGMK